MHQSREQVSRQVAQVSVRQIEGRATAVTDGQQRTAAICGTRVYRQYK